MQSNKASSDPNAFVRDPRSIPPRRISHYGNNSRRTSQNKDGKNEDSEISRAKRKETEDDDSDVDTYNFEKLKSFHIPRKKGQEEKELLSELSLKSREFTHTIFPSVRSSFFDPQANRKITFNQVELVQNPKLEKEYLQKRKDMKDEGRSDKDLVDSYGFLHVFKRKEVEKICTDGLHVGHCNLQSLGKPEMGVYVCKHADIVRFSRWEENQSGFIIMFKVIKGRIKLVQECRNLQTTQEPTPLYDCHVTKLPIDVAQSIHSRAYQAFQYYFYEYGEIDVEKRPRQIQPYAVLKYIYSESPTSPAGLRSSRRESSTDELPSDLMMQMPSCDTSFNSDDGFCHWRGKLLVKNGTFCSVEMRSWFDTVFNVANIDRSINIKTCLSLDKLKRQLPPTLMSKTAKKYNVIYRGRFYNTFTLHPTEEGSGLGKFRQLVGHLVQRSSAAFVPLRNNSSLYLLPLSSLTEEMGLRGISSDSPASDSNKQSKRAWKNFLHVIIITPKALSSKINDQRVYNIIHVRKRKDNSSSAPPSPVRDNLEQKLRQMNIDPSSSLSSMEPDQQERVYSLLKDKKKLQTSEKMLHNFYKDVEILSPPRKDDAKKNFASKWLDVPKLQQDFYINKKKMKVPLAPGGAKRSRSTSRGSTEGQISPRVPIDEGSEATFSDDEEPQVVKSTPPAFKLPRKQPRLEDPRISSITNVPFDTEEVTPPHVEPEKDKPVPFQYTPTSKPRTPGAMSSPSILRPSFKPLEELIFSENLEELMKHPEFSFTEKHCSNHTVTGFIPSADASSLYTPWEENRPKIMITFSHTVPHTTIGCDCPYAFEMDPLIISMLRAIHGDYDHSMDTPQEHDKVKWVRGVLHSRGVEDIDENVPDTVDPSDTIPGMTDRKIVEEKPSPAHNVDTSPQQSSTDSGFISSSAAATPVLDSPSLKEIAAILATALNQSKGSPSSSSSAPVVTSMMEQKLEEDTHSNDMENAAKVLLQALAQTPELPGEVKQSPLLEDGELAESTPKDGVTDMDLGSTPEQSPISLLERSQSLSHDTTPTLNSSQEMMSPSSSMPPPESSPRTPGTLGAPPQPQGPTSMYECFIFRRHGSFPPCFRSEESQKNRHLIFAALSVKFG